MTMDIDYYQNLRYDYEISKGSKIPINLKLMFSNEVASLVFTRQIIVGKASDDGGNNLKVVLVDRNTHETITAGQVASAKVKIVLLRGDYCGSATKEFEKNIVVNWKNKKNILLGDLYVDLKHGCGTVGEIRIKHDRNPIKNVKFRLGAMVIDCPYEIEKAMTNLFEVKDNRNLPKNLRPLSLEDNVGRLKNISNKSTGKIRIRLESENIRTVKNFLDMHSLNPRELQEICGVKGKKWEMMVNHAKTSLKGDVRLGSTSQQSNPLASIGYMPRTCEDKHFNIPEDMIIDSSFSYTEIPECEIVFINVEENGVNAKKRWMKLRLLPIVLSCTKKFWMCGGYRCDPSRLSLSIGVF